MPDNRQALAHTSVRQMRDKASHEAGGRTLHLSLWGAVLVGAITYLLVGPLPCLRSASRCGLVAFDYSNNVGLLPPQAGVAMVITSSIAFVSARLSIEREGSPRWAKAAGVVIVVGLVLLANAGAGGLVGLGAPLALPLLWLLSHRSNSHLRWVWVGLAALSAATGSWMVAALLDRDWGWDTALPTTVLVTIFFLATARRSRSFKSPEG